MIIRKKNIPNKKTSTSSTQEVSAKSGKRNVIKKEDVPATNITPEQYTQIMNQVSVKDPNNISPSEYAKRIY